MDIGLIKDRISINCHSSICLCGNVYIDPYNINEEVNNAKVIFITHSHYDHCDLRSIECIMSKDTKIVATADVLNKVRDIGIGEDNLIEVQVGVSGEVDTIRYETIPAYNIDKSFHPRANDWVGYTIIIDGVRYTICGDTDATEELKDVDTDVMLVPIGGKYTMDYKEASAVVNIVKPQVAIPTHYGSVVGEREYGEKFANLVDPKINVLLLI